jgi:hypothetical protein
MAADMARQANQQALPVLTAWYQATALSFHGNSLKTNDEKNRKSPGDLDHLRKALSARLTLYAKSDAQHCALLLEPEWEVEQCLRKFTDQDPLLDAQIIAGNALHLASTLRLLRACHAVLPSTSQHRPTDEDLHDAKDALCHETDRILSGTTKGMRGLKRNASKKALVPSLRDEFEQALRKDIALRGMRTTTTSNETHLQADTHSELQEMLSWQRATPNIYFSQRLDPQQRMEGLIRLWEYKKANSDKSQLRGADSKTSSNSLLHHPIIIGETFARLEGGFVEIPYEFHMEELERFVLEQQLHVSESWR